MSGTPRRVLGRSGIEVGALGMGTWPLGGPLTAGGRDKGWGPVDDAESVRALRRAADLGVTFFDTADSYGAGHAERVLARALGTRREELVWATKWGNVCDEATRRQTGTDHSPGYARRALQASLRRLGTDHVDLWLLHLHDLPVGPAGELVTLCEDLVREGSVRAYGWSTDDPARARVFARGAHCAAVEHQMDVLDDDPALPALCEAEGLAAVIRGPLAMGLLTDGMTAGTRVTPGDVRHRPPPWLRWFTGGRPDPGFLARREAVRDLLTGGGRTLAQGALAWLWARSPVAVPIPGCRTVAQVQENAGALAYGPLDAATYAAVEAVLRPAEAHTGR